MLQNIFFQDEEIPMADMSYPEGSTHAPPPGGVRIYPPAPVSICSVNLF